MFWVMLQKKQLWVPKTHVWEKRLKCPSQQSLSGDHIFPSVLSVLSPQTGFFKKRTINGTLNVTNMCLKIEVDINSLCPLFLGCMQVPGEFLAWYRTFTLCGETLNFKVFHTNTSNWQKWLFKEALKGYLQQCFQIGPLGPSTSPYFHSFPKWFFITK